MSLLHSQVTYRHYAFTDMFNGDEDSNLNEATISVVVY